MAQQSSFVRNRLLACLPPPVFETLRPHLTHATLRRQEILIERNRPVEEVFFIEEGVASIFARTQVDGLVEVGMVGRLGLVGISVALGTSRSQNRCVMQIAGTALKMRASALQGALNDSHELREVLLGYVHALLTQHSQTALCNVRHDLKSRLCRWLLLAADRLDSESIPLSHDSISMILGVRRAGVTTALAALEAQGALRKSRADVDIVDRDILERHVCECYSIISREYGRLTDRTRYDHEFSGAAVPSIVPQLS